MRSKARSSLSWLLSLLMVFTMMPAMWMTAYAESESSVAPTVTMSEVTAGTYTYGDAGATVTITATFSNSTDYDTGKNGSVVKLELFKNDANTQVSNGCIASGSMAPGTVSNTYTASCCIPAGAPFSSLTELSWKPGRTEYISWKSPPASTCRGTCWT